MEEDALTGWLRRRQAASGGGLIGDDAAILPDSETWAVTIDTQIEGVHFLSGQDPGLVARRLLAVNLSDLAAMGARPAYGFLALAAPPGFEHRVFFDAFLNAGRRVGVELAGGDLARSECLTTVLTLLGRRPPGGSWLRRSAARPGDALWLGGSLGESAAGALLCRRGSRLDGRRVSLPEDFKASKSLQAAARRAVRRHLQPTAQLELGEWLGKKAHGFSAAAIDLSDGLARDLHRLCRESRVGAEIKLERLPMARGFHRLAAALGAPWHDLALAGGEDYVLLFTLPPSVRPPERFACHQIGRVLDRRGVFLVKEGLRHPLEPAGWDHLRKKPRPKTGFSFDAADFEGA